MIDDDTKPEAPTTTTTAEDPAAAAAQPTEEHVQTKSKRTRKTTAKAKAKAAPRAKKVAANGSGDKRARFADDAVFKVNWNKAEKTKDNPLGRTEKSSGYKHLQWLDGKTYGQVKKSDKFQPYRLKRDLDSGALKVS